MQACVKDKKRVLSCDQNGNMTAPIYSIHTALQKIQLLLQACLGQSADHLIDNLAALDEQDGRNAHYVVLLGGIGILVHIDLADFHLTGIFSSKLFYNKMCIRDRSGELQAQARLRYSVPKPKGNQV